MALSKGKISNSFKSLVGHVIPYNLKSTIINIIMRFFMIIFYNNAILQHC